MPSAKVWQLPLHVKSFILDRRTMDLHVASSFHSTEVLLFITDANEQHYYYSKPLADLLLVFLLFLLLLRMKNRHEKDLICSFL